MYMCIYIYMYMCVYIYIKKGIRVKFGTPKLRWCINLFPIFFYGQTWRPILHTWGELRQVTPSPDIYLCDKEEKMLYHWSGTEVQPGRPMGRPICPMAGTGHDSNKPWILIRASKSLHFFKFFLSNTWVFHVLGDSSQRAPLYKITQQLFSDDKPTKFWRSVWTHIFSDVQRPGLSQEISVLDSVLSMAQAGVLA